MTARAVELLGRYVAIPSVNPMGRTDLPAAQVGERRYAEQVEADLRRIGVDAVCVGEGARRSVVAEVRAAGARETVMVASHLDTVPVDDMEIDPFDPRVEDERLYGRGSCDTKAGLATLVAALEELLPAGRMRRNLVLVGEADEELGSRGVCDVLAHLGGRRPDWALATEPTGMRVVTHHKGIAVARIAASGVACHSSDPDAGRSAIVTLARLVLAVEGLRDRLAGRRHAVLGPGTCSVGLVHGGKAPNVVADAAWLVMDRRLVPGEDEATVRSELEALLAEPGLEGTALESLRVGKPPLEADPEGRAARACGAALRALSLEPAPCGVAFGTDAALLAAEGIPSVVLGPGAIAQAHTAREYVELAQVEAMTRFYIELLSTPGA